MRFLSLNLASELIRYPTISSHGSYLDMGLEAALFTLGYTITWKWKWNKGQRIKRTENQLDRLLTITSHAKMN